jgi:hypothetical protein
MVIDCGDVRVRAPADFAHRRVAEPRLGENLAPRLQKLAACLGMTLSSGTGWQLQFHFKQIIQTNV